MNNVNKELPKALTMDKLKERIGKPVFVIKYNEISNRTDFRWAIFKTLNEEILEFTDGVENLKIGDNICFFNKEVTKEDFFVILKEEKEKLTKKTGYETVGKGEDYFFITAKMEVETVYPHQCSYIANEAREACANHFNDKTLAINIARAERLRYQLRRFAALNGGISSIEDWVCRLDWKYLIAYDYNEQKLYINAISKFKNFGQVYFKSEEACKKALEIFKDELLWYFTEFKEMLY